MSKSLFAGGVSRSVAGLPAVVIRPGVTLALALSAMAASACIGGPAAEEGADATTDDDGGGDDTGEPQAPPGEMVFVPGGSFVDFYGAHDVGDLWFNRTEVTVAEYRRCVAEGACEAVPPSAAPCAFNKPGYAEWPIDCIDDREGEKYCAWAGGRRLPTMHEWVWAARGRDEGRTFPWGNQWPSCERLIWGGDESGPGCGTDETWPVGSRSPAGDSRDGVQDMAGNASEWTSTFDPSMEEGYGQAEKGGDYVSAEASSVAVNFTNWQGIGASGRALGFRCVRDP